MTERAEKSAEKQIVSERNMAMILADKIIRERKKLGLSQEELAEKMNVSRQAVSKWEGAQSIPDIDKILQLSRLFGVTTDYLLKDEIEAEERCGAVGGEAFSGEGSAQAAPTVVVEKSGIFPFNNKTVSVGGESFSGEGSAQAAPTVVVEKSGIFPFNNKTVSVGAESGGVREQEPQAPRTVTVKQAEDYLGIRKTAARNIAIGTFLCIISVIPLITLSGCGYLLSSDTAGILGLVIMLAIVAMAVGLFLYTGFKNSPYEFLEKEPFETEDGAAEMVKERQEAFRDTYAKFNIMGTILCVLSPISLFIGAISENENWTLIGLSVMMIIAGIGVLFFILAGVRHESMQRLLKEGDHSEAAKESKGIKGTVATVYWLAAVAVYLLLLFLAGDQVGGWRSDNSWIIWPVAGVLFPAVMALCGFFEKNGRKK